MSTFIFIGLIAFMWFSWGRLTIDDYEQSSSCDMYFGVIYIMIMNSHICVTCILGYFILKLLSLTMKFKKNMVLNSTETELRQLSMGAWGVPDS